MGSGFKIRCKNCNYEFTALLGIGSTFPVTYGQTVREIKSGMYGDKYQRFFEEHGNACVNCGETVALCTECGRLETVMDLSLYLTEDRDAEMRGYVMPRELEEFCQKEMEYDHKCSACGGSLRIIDIDAPDVELKCPDCGGELEQDKGSSILWD